MKKSVFSALFLATAFYLVACDGTGSSGADELFNEDSSSSSCSSEWSSSGKGFSSSSSSKNSSSSQKIDYSNDSKNSSSSNETGSSSSSIRISKEKCADSAEGTIRHVLDIGLAICHNGVFVSYTYPSSSSKSQPAEYVEECPTEDAWEYLNPILTYGTITDKRDGQKYKTIRIGNQNWMAQNLNYYQNSEKTDVMDSSIRFVDKGCGAIGRYYTWKDAMRLQDCDDPSQCPDSIGMRQGICPEGFHIPTSKEFKELLDYTSVSSNNDFTTPLAARISKRQSLAGWTYDAVSNGIYSVMDGTYNTSGFSLLASGMQSKRTENGLKSETQRWVALLGTDSLLTLHIEPHYDVKIFDVFNSAFNIRCIENIENMDPSPEPITFPPSEYNGTYEDLYDNRDGKNYKTVQIGNQIWMAENLNYEAPHSECYAQKEENCQTYGRLYPWYVAIGKTNEECLDKYEHNLCGGQEAPVQGICPDGWHLPDSLEFKELVTYVTENYNKDDSPSNGLRSPSDWLVTDSYGTDIFGFAALPGGSKNSEGLYKGLNAYTKFWSINGTLRPTSLIITFSGWELTNNNVFLNGLSEDFAKGMESVRCIKDTSP